MGGTCPMIVTATPGAVVANTLCIQRNCVAAPVVVSLQSPL